MKEAYGSSEKEIGFIFTASDLSYTLVAFLVSYLAEVDQRKKLALTGLSLVTGSLFFMGPSLILGLGKSLFMITTSMFINGIGFTMIFVFVTPEAIRSVSERFNIEVGKNDSLNDKASALFEWFFSLGQFIGPPIGGALADWLGYRRSMDVLAVLSTVVTIAVIYGMVGKK